LVPVLIYIIFILYFELRCIVLLIDSPDLLLHFGLWPSTCLSNCLVGCGILILHVNFGWSYSIWKSCISRRQSFSSGRWGPFNPIGTRCASTNFYMSFVLKSILREFNPFNLISCWGIWCSHIKCRSTTIGFNRIKACPSCCQACDGYSLWSTFIQWEVPLSTATLSGIIVAKILSICSTGVSACAQPICGGVKSSIASIPTCSPTGIWRIRALMFHSCTPWIMGARYETSIDTTSTSKGGCKRQIWRSNSSFTLLKESRCCKQEKWE